jgi:hypothetical protein
MKVLVKLYPLLIIVVFIFSCAFSAKMSNSFLDRLSATTIEESQYPKSWMRIIAFSSGKLYITDLDHLEEFKRTHTDYSFLLPNQDDENFSKMLIETVQKDNYRLSPNVSVRQISENEQEIYFEIVGNKSSGATKYIANSKSITPLSYTESNFVGTFIAFCFGIIGGIVGIFIFRAIFNKYIKPKAVEA